MDRAAVGPRGPRVLRAGVVGRAGWSGGRLRHAVAAGRRRAVGGVGAKAGQPTRPTPAKPSPVRTPVMCTTSPVSGASIISPPPMYMATWSDPSGP
jgi:hypothetical protein